MVDGDTPNIPDAKIRGLLKYKPEIETFNEFSKIIRHHLDGFLLFYCLFHLIGLLCLIMKAYVLETPIGILITNQNESIFESYLVKSLDDEDLLHFLHYDTAIRAHPSFSSFLDQLNRKKYDLVVETKEMKKLLEPYQGAISLSIIDDIFLKQHAHLQELLKNLDFPLSKAELASLSRKNAKLLSRDLVRESGQNTDIHIINAVGVLENTIKFINTYAVQLREWYGSHFPELTDKLVNDVELYAKIVSLYEKREAITSDKLIADLHVKEEYAKEIEIQAKSSMGGDLTELQLDAIRLFSNKILDLIKFRDNLDKSVNNLLQELTPNLHKILGSQLTGKLITHAGGLEHLAKMPSSTIQILGAEKALFRALRKKTDSPKHGVIYTWPPIRSAKYWQRGKISRLLSGKISICAKVDFFKGDFIGDKLLEDLEKKIAEIKERFPDPPKIEKKKQDREFTSKKKDIARKKAYHMSKSKYKSGIKKKGKKY
jgi:nucleolar protein 56